MYSIHSAKGQFNGNLEEVCAWQAEMQGAWATLYWDNGAFSTNVDDVDFDSDDLPGTIKRVEAVIEKELDAYNNG